MRDDTRCPGTLATRLEAHSCGEATGTDWIAASVPPNPEARFFCRPTAITTRGFTRDAWILRGIPAAIRCLFIYSILPTGELPAMQQKGTGTRG